MKPDFDIRYDRRVSPEFLAHFAPGGVAASITAMMRKRALYPLDLQFRRSPKTGAEHATLYTGLTAVLNIHRTKDGLRLSAHKTWSGRHGFNSLWGDSAAELEWKERWRDVELYLERVIPVATKSHGVTEGAVQAAVSSSGGKKRLMLDREVTPSFRNAKLKNELLTQCRRPILDVLSDGAFGPGKVPERLGAECDLIALDSAAGEVLAIEVKPLAGGRIHWVAAQATMYARVLQMWVDNDEEGLACEVLLGMLSQRQSLGLCPQVEVELPVRPRIRPVIALQRGASQHQRDRMMEVRDALAKADLGVPPVKVYEVSITGDMAELA